MGNLNPHRPERPLAPSQARPQKSAQQRPSRQAGHNQQGNRSGGLEDRHIADSRHSGKSTSR